MKGVALTVHYDECLRAVWNASEWSQRVLGLGGGDGFAFVIQGAMGASSAGEEVILVMQGSRTRLPSSSTCMATRTWTMSTTCTLRCVAVCVRVLAAAVANTHPRTCTRTYRCTRGAAACPIKLTAVLAWRIMGRFAPQIGICLLLFRRLCLSLSLSYFVRARSTQSPPTPSLTLSAYTIHRCVSMAVYQVSAGRGGACSQDRVHAGARLQP